MNIAKSSRTLVFTELIVFNPFHVNDLFYTPENSRTQEVFRVFRGYRKKPVA